MARTTGSRSSAELIVITYPAPVQSPISFRSSSVGTNPLGSAVLSIARPAGVQSGDLLLATVDVRQTTVATPAGWTLLAQDTFSAVALTKATYWRVATGSEPATYTFALGSARGASGAIVAYSGVDPSNPIDDSQAQQNANGTTITAPSVSASSPGGMLVALYGVTVVTSIGQPAGMTERGEVSNSIFAKATTTEVSDQALVASGLTGARTASHGGESPRANIGRLVVLRPAP